MYGKLFYLVKGIVGEEYTIGYTGVEGAVAILRQLAAGLHLEGDRELYFKIRQYLNRIWMVGSDADEQALREFKT